MGNLLGLWEFTEKHVHACVYFNYHADTLPCLAIRIASKVSNGITNTFSQQVYISNFRVDQLNVI